MNDITAYIEFIWSGAGAPSPAQWNLLRLNLPEQPFASAITTAARASGNHPNRALHFASQSLDETRWLGQVTINASATKSSVHDPADRQHLRTLYEEAGGTQPPEGWDTLTIQDVLLQILDYWAEQHSVSGSTSAKLAGVLQAEARQVGAALGFSAGQQANLSIATVFLGDPAAAQAAALALKTDEDWA